MQNVSIHPTAIVQTDQIGDGTRIGPFCFIGKKVKIGKNCKFFGHCSIGTSAEYKNEPDDTDGFVHIDDNTSVREFVTVGLPTGKITYIGKNVVILSGAHVPHDAYISDDVFITSGTMIGGFTSVGRGCYLGLNCVLHQRSQLGAYCLVGAGAFFKGESIVGIIWAGVPAKPIKVNRQALENYVQGCEERERITEAATKFISNWKA